MDKTIVILFIALHCWQLGIQAVESNSKRDNGFCDENQYYCSGDQRCIPKYWHCDYYDDCTNGEDEAGCPCHFKCEVENKCIREQDVCDGYTNCYLSKQDENDCDSCKGYAFHCVADRKCVNSWQRCDYKKDCPSGEDEADCDCDFQCGDFENTCIRNEHLCDGQKHCPNGRDENDCDSCNKEYSYYCASDRLCIQGGDSIKCNYYNDCPSGDDEVGCPCDFRCESGEKCIRNYGRCNGWPSCSDGSDEKNCDSCSDSYSFYCAADKTCIPGHYRCDSLRTKHCESGADEIDCPCEYNCQADGYCIPNSRVCDGFKHCSDEQDEQNCDSCPYFSFHCSADRMCLPMYKKCNGKSDCPSGQDEIDCS